MSFLFKSKEKSPGEVVKATKEALQKIDPADQKKQEEASKNLSTIKHILYGDAENEPVPEVVAQAAQEVYNNDILFLLVQNLSKLDFEGKKDTTLIFGHLLRRQIGNRFPTVEHICTKPQLVLDLVKGYGSGDIAMTSGAILRDCNKFEPLTKIILDSPSFYNFFDYVETAAFDIASDSFSTFKEILTKHKTLVAEFLEKNYDQFFAKYLNLLNSSNYVTKRQSLKLLGELLLDRSNFNTMTKYIANTDNLKLMMNLLRDKSKNIQFEAFHVFKVFVANPNKPKPIVDILVKNKEKLVAFLGNFQNDRQDDEQFNDEKAFLLKQIQEI